jgi:hypothetical protein
MYPVREVNFDEVSVASQKSFLSTSSYAEGMRRTDSVKKRHQSFIKGGSPYVERALELLGEHLHPGSSVLEIGTRNTDGLIALRGIVKSSGVVHGIALSEIESNQVWAQLQADGLQEGIHVHAETTASQIVRPNSLDGIAIQYVAELLEPDAAQSLLAECRSCLKPTGHLAVVCATAAPSRFMSSRKLKMPSLRSPLEAEGYSCDVVKTVNKSGWNVEIILASVVDDIAEEFKEALEKSSESGTPVRRANDESFAERQCSTPLRIDSTTSSFVERSWDGTHCVTPETASETLGGTPPPMESATRQPENSMNCVEAAELFSLGKGRYQSPVSAPTKPATSKQKKYKKSLLQLSEEMSSLEDRVELSDSEVSALRAAVKAEKAKRHSLRDQLQALKAEPSCTRSQLQEWLDSCMTPSEIDAMADTDAAQVPVKPLLLAMANTYQEHRRNCTLQLEQKDAMVASIVASLKESLADQDATVNDLKKKVDQFSSQLAHIPAPQEALTLWPYVSAQKKAEETQQAGEQDGFVQILKKLVVYLAQFPF